MSESVAVNYYELLDVPADARNLEIIRAYRRAKLAYRIDSIATYSLFDERELERIRTDIEQAYQTLSDPERRQAYDAELSASPTQAPRHRPGRGNR